MLVSLADKLDNARAILRDYRRRATSCGSGSATKDPQEHLWYYRSLLAVFKRRSTTWLVAGTGRAPFLHELEAQIRTAV